MARTLEDRLYTDDGPKRILALDGGGVRGSLTLAYLAEIEDLLGRRSGDPERFRLCDYFDLIGGTSTGAIIAACLAKGDRVAEIQKMYQELAGAVFTKPRWRFGILVPKYNSAQLSRVLKEHFGSMTLGSEKLLTGLVIVAKRLDTTSTWPMTNLPRGRYFGQRPGSNAIPNKDYSLARVLRASTAAPHYFDPEPLDITSRLQGTFIDGGVSTANNPALLLFLIATLKGYSLGWKTGADELLLVSVGTGASPDEIKTGGIVGGIAAAAAAKALVTMMVDADALNRTLLQAISASKTAETIDSEIGDLGNDMLAGRPLLSYLRYNVELDSTWLRDNLSYSADAELVIRLRKMDNAKSVGMLAEVGRHAAAKQILSDHFPSSFDRVAGSVASTDPPSA